MSMIAGRQLIASLRGRGLLGNQEGQGEEGARGRAGSVTCFIATSGVYQISIGL
jgi:hypothetical protein